MCISDKTEICPFVHILIIHNNNIIIITRPGAHTTKYNHQWGNLQMGHVQQCIHNLQEMHNTVGVYKPGEPDKGRKPSQPEPSKLGNGKI